MKGTSEATHPWTEPQGGRGTETRRRRDTPGVLVLPNRASHQALPALSMKSSRGKGRVSTLATTLSQGLALKCALELWEPPSSPTLPTACLLRPCTEEQRKTGVRGGRGTAYEAILQWLRGLPGLVSVCPTFNARWVQNYPGGSGWCECGSPWPPPFPSGRYVSCAYVTPGQDSKHGPG